MNIVWLLLLALPSCRCSRSRSDRVSLQVLANPDIETYQEFSGSGPTGTLINGTSVEVDDKGQSLNGSTAALISNTSLEADHNGRSPNGSAGTFINTTSVEADQTGRSLPPGLAYTDMNGFSNFCVRCGPSPSAEDPTEKMVLVQRGITRLGPAFGIFNQFAFKFHIMQIDSNGHRVPIRDRSPIGWKSFAADLRDDHGDHSCIDLQNQLDDANPGTVEQLKKCMSSSEPLCGPDLEVNVLYPHPPYKMERVQTDGFCHLAKESMPTFPWLTRGSGALLPKQAPSPSSSNGLTEKTKKEKATKETEKERGQKTEKTKKENITKEAATEKDTKTKAEKTKKEKATKEATEKTEKAKKQEETEKKKEKATKGTEKENAAKVKAEKTKKQEENTEKKKEKATKDTEKEQAAKARTEKTKKEEGKKETAEKATKQKETTEKTKEKTTKETAEKTKKQEATAEKTKKEATDEKTNKKRIIECQVCNRIGCFKGGNAKSCKTWCCNHGCPVKRFSCPPTR